MTVRTDAVRPITVDLSVDVLTLLDAVVPEQDREQFIVEATENALRRERLRRVVADLREGPAWTDENHPDLMTVEDVDRHVRRLRESWMPRTWDEIAEEAEKEAAHDQPPSGQ
jgi:hypothetical protein